MKRALHFLFGFDAPIDRTRYLAVGLSLLALEYAIEATFLRLATGAFFPPWNFVVPIWKIRTATYADAPSWVFVVLAAITLPFFVIGLSFSIRRAVDAGRSAFLGLGFAFPLVSYVVIAVLAALPSRAKRDADDVLVVEPNGVPTSVRAAVVASFAAAAFGFFAAAIAAQGLDAYGSSLFFATPLFMGVIAGYLANRERTRGGPATIGIALLALAITSGALMLFALEGLVCLVMVAPLAGLVAAFGALVGRSLATRAHRLERRSIALFLFVPLAAFGERALTPPSEHVVVSTVEIDAPPEVVFRRVVAFSDLPEPDEWIFRTGIAYPRRARIVGEGVSAVRHCEFSTGAFVEPITAWEPPHRLAFDVASQPPPMKERTFYRAIHPPHLDSMLRSRRGEFRLVALPGGRTRLEGRTWYELRAAPTVYFRLYSDAIIHAIHLRVLEHVKHLAEAT